MASNNSFNFDAYNNMMKGVGVGLKLHLAVQLVKDVVSGLEHFDNPLEAEIRPVYHDLKNFHGMYKEAAKARAAKAENQSEKTADIDNSTKPVIGVSDMMAMFQMFQQMQAAQKDGDHLKAHYATESMVQVGDGVLHTQGDQLAA